MKKKEWEDGWEKGHQDGYKDAIDHLVYVLESADLRKLYEKEWRK